MILVTDELGAISTQPIRTSADEPSPVNVSAKILELRNQAFLEFEIQSRVGHSIQVPAELMPWRSPGYTLVMAIDTRGERLNDAYAVLPGIVGVPTLDLLPGQAMRGRINLDERFPDLRSRLSNQDILILWSYKPALLNAEGGARLAGALVMPKRS
jgi:hypothetical protein